jgi:hypothetical protein
MFFVNSSNCCSNYGTLGILDRVQRVGIFGFLGTFARTWSNLLATLLAQISPSGAIPPHTHQSSLLLTQPLSTLIRSLCYVFLSLGMLLPLACRTLDWLMAILLR